MYFTAVERWSFFMEISFFKYTGLDDDDATDAAAADFFGLYLHLHLHASMVNGKTHKRNHKWLDSTLWKSVDL